MRFINLLGVIICICLVNTGAVPTEDEGEIILLSIIFRHGARTTYSFYPNDPYKDEQFYPYGKGELTNNGKLGEYNLGKYLKSLYSDFLGPDYTVDKVHVRSTDVTRTKMSAQLVMAGLFPPSEPLVWNSELLWLPVPIDYKESSKEDIFHRESNCKFKLDALGDLKNIQEVEDKFITPYKYIYQYVEQHSGKSINVPSDMQDLFFNLKCEADMNYTLPQWTDSVYPLLIEDAACVVYDFHNYNPEVRKINSGYMLKRILDDAESKIKGTIDPSERKIMLYSGHESTMGYMLSALNLDQAKVPSYGSALSFELRKKDDEYFIKLRLRNDPEAWSPIDLTPPGCDNLCPFDKFKDIYSDLIPTLSIDDACNQDYNEYKKSWL